MIIEQFKDESSSTFTYIVAHSKGAEALIIDPVLENVEDYLKFLGENNLRLIKAFDTHIHADHVTGLGKLRELTGCMTILGEHADTHLVSQKVQDGDMISIDHISFKVMYTPGHTDCSYSLFGEGVLFTGDTLLIRGNGRTDFQNGNPKDLYQSIKTLLSLPDEITIFPGHDYKGENRSTVGREKKENPRFAGKTEQEFIEIMNNLNLPNPKMMDIAVPANRAFGEDAHNNIPKHLNLNFSEAKALIDVATFIDLREPEEIKKTGLIPGAINIKYQDLSSRLQEENSELEKVLKTDKKIIFYCAYGERSGLAVKQVNQRFPERSSHLLHGIHGWIENKGPIK